MSSRNNGQKMSTTKGQAKQANGQFYKVASQKSNSGESCAVSALALVAGLAGLFEAWVLWALRGVVGTIRKLVGSTRTKALTLVENIGMVLTTRISVFSMCWVGCRSALVCSGVLLKGSRRE